MCEKYNFEEIINHPVLSDDTKINYFKEIVAEQDFIDVIDNLNDLGLSIDSLGLTIDDIDNLDYIWNLDDEDKSFPSSTSEFSSEEFSVINLYRYISTQYGPSYIGKNTRPFCKMLVSRTNASLMRREDITRLNSSNPGFGLGGSNTYSIFDFRGGSNCYHFFVKYKYDTETRNLVEAPVGDQPNQIKVNGKVPFANGTNSPDPR